MNKSKTNDFLDANNGREPLSSMLLVDDKNRYSGNGLSIDPNQISKNETKSNPALYVSLSVFASVIGLVIGIITGFVIKANYSQRLTQYLCKSKRNNNNHSKDSSNFEINSSDKDGSLEVISNRNQYIFGGNSSSKLSQVKSSNENTNDSLECSSRSSTEESFSGSTKSTNFNNENYCQSSASNSSRTSNLDLNRKYIRSKELFTVQNDYGILPKSYYEKAERYLAKKGGISSSSPPGKEKKLVNPNIAGLINNRLSSMSSSTDSSATHNAYNIINSQTSLLNASKESFRPKTGATKAALSPLSRHLSLNEKPVTYVSNYSNQNCIVVNDDDEEQEFNLNNNNSKLVVNNQMGDVAKRYSSLSSASSYGHAGMMDSIASSDASNNWASGTSRAERYHKNHHVRKHNSVIYSKVNRSSFINQNVGSNISNELKLSPELMIRDSLNKDYEKTKTYINNSYV